MQSSIKVNSTIKNGIQTTRIKVDQSGERYISFLGHKWDKEKDTMLFKKDKVVMETENIAKRNCLACVAQLWDTIGLLAPVTLKFRIDLQELWSLGYSWDEILPDEVQTKWKENFQEMNKL